MNDVIAISWLIFVGAIFFGIRHNLARKRKINTVDKKNSTKFTMNGKEYDSVEDYYGKFTKRTPGSLKEVFGGLEVNNIPNHPDNIQNKIKEVSGKAKDVFRSILFIIVLLILMGMIYYYVAK